MKQNKTISGKNPEEIWQQMVADYTSTDLHDYHTLIDDEKHTIEITIVSSPGGSGEGGYDTTTITSQIINTNFRFAIHPEDFLNKIGKLLGMQDVKTGYSEFDENVIVKTNDEDVVKRIFADSALRDLFQSLSGYSFKTIHEDDGARLELYIQHAVSDTNELRKVFFAFHHVLTSIDQ
jgi:hypothetical protein